MSAPNEQSHGASNQKHSKDFEDKGTLDGGTATHRDTSADRNTHTYDGSNVCDENHEMDENDGKYQNGATYENGALDGNDGAEANDGTAINLRMTSSVNENGNAFDIGSDGGFEGDQKNADSAVVTIPNDDAKNKLKERQPKFVKGNDGHDVSPQNERPSGLKGWFVERFYPDNPKYVDAVKWLWEIFFYVLFLVNLSCVMLLMQDSESFYLFNNSVKAAFVDKQEFIDGNSDPINFNNIDDMSHLWNVLSLVSSPLYDSRTAIYISHIHFMPQTISRIIYNNHSFGYFFVGLLSF